MIRVVLIAAALAGSAPAVAAQPQWQTVAEFTKSPSRGSEHVSVSIEMSDYRPGEPAVYRAERRGTSAGGKTDSTQCPALRSVVDSISDIPVPALKPGPAVIIVSDGTGYSLTVRSGNDTIAINSGWGPVAQWVDKVLVSLEDCWSFD